jgi:hypothetical protein
MAFATVSVRAPLLIKSGIHLSERLVLSFTSDIIAIDVSVQGAEEGGI